MSRYFTGKPPIEVYLDSCTNGFPEPNLKFDNQIDDEQLRAIEQEVINYSLAELYNQPKGRAKQ